MNNKYNNIPERENFDKFFAKKGWKNEANAVWNICQSKKWLKIDGSPMRDWRAYAGVWHEIYIVKSGVKRKKIEKTSPTGSLGEFPDNGLHYVCYTDGSCDNLSREKAGGAAYIVIKDGEIVRIKSHGQLNTTNNRMELLAIISAVSSCPQGAFVDVYTDSQYCILVLSKDFKPKKNPDLYELYKKSKAHLSGVRFHWVKGHNGDKYNEMVDNLAYSAYCDVCDTYNIEKSRRH